jgi:fatty acid-binding protein DegV
LSGKFGTKKVKVAVGHCQNPEQAKILKEMLTQSLNVSGEAKMYIAGLAIVMNMGPGTVCAAVYQEP